MWHSTTVILCVFYLIAIRITILNGYKCMQLFVQIKVVFKTSTCCKTPIALKLFEFSIQLMYRLKSKGYEVLEKWKWNTCVTNIFLGSFFSEIKKSALTEVDSTYLLFFVSSYIVNDSMFKCIDIKYIFSILDLKCCSYGCGCRRECRAPDFSTGPQRGKLYKIS